MKITANIIAEFEADCVPWVSAWAQRQRSASKKDRHTCGLHLTVFSQTRQEPLEKTVRNTASRDSLDHLRE